MSSSGDWGPAPPGVDLSESQSGEILRASVALMVLGICAVSARLWARVIAGAGLALDDYFIIAALVSV